MSTQKRSFVAVKNLSDDFSVDIFGKKIGVNFDTEVFKKDENGKITLINNTSSGIVKNYFLPFDKDFSKTANAAGVTYTVDELKRILGMKDGAYLDLSTGVAEPVMVSGNYVKSNYVDNHEWVGSPIFDVDSTIHDALAEKRLMTVADWLSYKYKIMLHKKRILNACAGDEDLFNKFLDVRFSGDMLNPGPFSIIVTNGTGQAAQPHDPSKPVTITIKPTKLVTGASDDLWPVCSDDKQLIAGLYFYTAFLPVEHLGIEGATLPGDFTPKPKIAGRVADVLPGFNFR